MAVVFPLFELEAVLLQFPVSGTVPLESSTWVLWPFQWAIKLHDHGISYYPLQKNKQDHDDAKEATSIRLLWFKNNYYFNI